MAIARRIDLTERGRSLVRATTAGQLLAAAGLCAQALADNRNVLLLLALVAMGTSCSTTSARTSLAAWRLAHSMVGMVNAAPSRCPAGQRVVTVLVRVKNRIESGPCWFRSPNPERFQPPKV